MLTQQLITAGTRETSKHVSVKERSSTFRLSSPLTLENITAQLRMSWGGVHLSPSLLTWNVSKSTLITVCLNQFTLFQLFFYHQILNIQFIERRLLCKPTVQPINISSEWFSYWRVSGQMSLCFMKATKHLP